MRQTLPCACAVTSIWVVDVGEVGDLLYRRSGLPGVSGISGDLRVLEASGDARAELALDLLVDCVAAETGAMAVFAWTRS